MPTLVQVRFVHLAPSHCEAGLKALLIVNDQATLEQYLDRHYLGGTLTDTASFRMHRAQVCPVWAAERYDRIALAEAMGVVYSAERGTASGSYHSLTRWFQGTAWAPWLIREAGGTQWSWGAQTPITEQEAREIQTMGLAYSLRSHPSSSLVNDLTDGGLCK